MGGNINIYVRDVNDKVYGFDAYTGDEDILFYSKEFNEKDYQAALLNFRKKIRKNADGEKYTTKHLYPSGYGLIVIDLKDMIIHSMQGYKEIGTTGIMRYSPVMFINKGELEKVDELIKLDYLSLYHEGGDLIGDFKECLGDDINMIKLRTNLKENVADVEMVLKNNVKVDKYLLNIKPVALANFQLKYYEENKEDVEKFQQNLVNTGFKLSKKDMKMWEDFVDENNI